MNKIIIANWKANPQSVKEAAELYRAEVAQAEKFEKVETVICPPFVFLEELAAIDRSHLGAQDIFWKESGPYTGEISTDMLKNLGVSHVLIGHSDRRYVLGETDEIINKKMKAALGAGIIPILLVGERERNDVREDVLVDQLSRGLKNIPADQTRAVLVAYEPVWAISTGADGAADTPENALEAIEMIKEIITKLFSPQTADSIKMLYGGSVNQDNAAGFLSYPEITGAVIGGASLKKDEFSEILKIANEL